MVRHQKYSILFLPGLLCDAAIWSDQAANLRDIADTSIADLTSDEAIGEMADRALAGAAEFFVLIGLSMGGYVALEIMRLAIPR
jgi:pimeloyl-ACP methyl ester carboxylesterase